MAVNREWLDDLFAPLIRAMGGCLSPSFLKPADVGQGSLLRQKQASKRSEWAAAGKVRASAINHVSNRRGTHTPRSKDAHPSSGPLSKHTCHDSQLTHLNLHLSLPEDTPLPPPPGIFEDDHSYPARLHEAPTSPVRHCAWPCVLQAWAPLLQLSQTSANLP